MTNPRTRQTHNEETFGLATQSYAFPGGYAIYFATDDGGVLCHRCVLENWLEVSTSYNEGSGWHVEGYATSADFVTTCDHCGNAIDDVKRFEATDPETLETGCFIGSAHGIYGIELLYDLAQELGVRWLAMADDLEIIRHYLYADSEDVLELEGTTPLSTFDCAEIVGEIYDEITERLPRSDPYYWYWSDGELFYGLDLSENLEQIADAAKALQDAEETLRNHISQAKETGWTQRDIASELGVHESTISRWLNPKP